MTAQQQEQIIPSEENPLYSVPTVARMFDVKEPTVREWLRDGTLAGVKIQGKWRVQKSECVRLANQEYGDRA